MNQLADFHMNNLNIDKGNDIRMFYYYYQKQYPLNDKTSQQINKEKFKNDEKNIEKNNRINQKINELANMSPNNTIEVELELVEFYIIITRYNDAKKILVNLRFSTLSLLNTTNSYENKQNYIVVLRKLADVCIKLDNHELAFIHYNNILEYFGTTDTTTSILPILNSLNREILDILEHGCKKLGGHPLYLDIQTEIYRIKTSINIIEQSDINTIEVLEKLVITCEIHYKKYDFIEKIYDIIIKERLRFQNYNYTMDLYIVMNQLIDILIIKEDYTQAEENITQLLRLVLDSYGQKHLFFIDIIMKFLYISYEQKNYIQVEIIVNRYIYTFQHDQIFINNNTKFLKFKIYLVYSYIEQKRWNEVFFVIKDMQYLDDIIFEKVINHCYEHEKKYEFKEVLIIYDLCKIICISLYGYNDNRTKHFHNRQLNIYNQLGKGIIDFNNEYNNNMDLETEQRYLANRRTQCKLVGFIS